MGSVTVLLVLLALWVITSLQIKNQTKLLKLFNIVILFIFLISFITVIITDLYS